MNEFTLYEIAMMVAGLVGVYTKLSQDITRLKSRIYQLESQSDEVRTTLRELVTMVAEIKLLLARKGIDE